MLRKLFKYEFKNTAKIMLTLYAVLIVTTLLGTLALYLATGSADRIDTQSGLPALLFAAAIIMYILSVFAVFIVTYVYMCTHFYKTMYSAQGYLTHTLPVTPFSTFNVKLVTSFVWLFVSVLLLFGSVFLLLNGASHGEVWAEFSTVFDHEVQKELSAAGISLGAFMFQVLITIIFSCLTYLLWVFASASIGQLFSTNKVAASIVAGVVLYFIQQILYLIGTFIFGLTILSENPNVFHAALVDIESPSAVLTIDHSLLSAANIYSFIVILVLYAICTIIVRKHINLE